MLITEQDKVFIPISLGNHYYSGKVLKYIRDAILPLCRYSHVLICDRLRVLIYKMRYLGTDLNISKKVDKEVEQFYRTLKNAGITRHNTHITTWNFASASTDYQRIMSGLMELVTTDKKIEEFLNVLVASLAKRFVRGALNDEILSIQQQYIIEETAVSVYMTEVFGMSTELYRREEDGLVKLLYDEYSFWLKEILGKSDLERRFVALESLIQLRN